MDSQIRTLPGTFQVDQTSAYSRTKNQMGGAGVPLFGCHTLSPTADSVQVKKQIIEGSCSFCLEPVASELPKPVTLLSCLHVYHQECIEPFLARKRFCPECRGEVKEGSVKVYSSTDELVDQLPKACSNPICTVRGTEQEIAEQAPRCPAPLSTLPHQKADNFLEKNQEFIVKWLNQQFEEKSYSTSNAGFNENYQGSRSLSRGKPAIEINVKFSGDSEAEKIYYSSVDINHGDTPEECFKNLLLDLRTDLVVLYLRKSYPAMFDQGTELYINTYDLWDHDKIYLNNYAYSIPLSKVFKPETKAFSWDNLKEEVEKLGFSYQNLFSSKRASRTAQSDSRLRSFPTVGYSDNAYFCYGGEASTDADGHEAVARSEPEPEIPSGMMDTSGILF